MAGVGGGLGGVGKAGGPAIKELETLEHVGRVSTGGDDEYKGVLCFGFKKFIKSLLASLKSTSDSSLSSFCCSP